MDNTEEALQSAKDALDAAIDQKQKTADFAKSVGPAILEILKPVLEEISTNSRLSKEELLQAVSQIKIDIPSVNVPEATVHVQLPDIPTPQVTVNTPEVKIPAQKAPIFKVPKAEVTVKQDSSVFTQVLGAIKDAISKQTDSIQPPEKHTFKNPMPIILTGLDGKPYMAGTMGGGAGRGGVSIIDNNGKQVSIRNLTNAVPLDVSLVDATGAQITTFGGGTQYNDSATPDQSGGVGTISMMFDGSSAQSWSGSSYGVGQVLLSDFDSSVYGISNPLPIRIAQVTDFNQSITITGVVDSTIVYQARTTNPTAVADGSDVRPKADKLGRPLHRPIQVRDLISTARVALTNGSETTLLAASGASIFLDCISIMASNNSSASVTLDVRSVTGGSIEFSIEVPANGVGGIAPPVPWPQGNANNNWTVDLPDITGTTVNIAAQFSQEV